MSDARTYFITWTTYGAWLPGDARRSFVDDRLEGRGISGPKPKLERAAREAMQGEQVVLGDAAREVVDRVIRQHAAFRGWPLAALNVRTNHVHLVVTVDRGHGRVMSEFKARATRALREAGLVGDDARVWTQHGSARHLHTEHSKARAVLYVMEGQ